MSIDAHLAVSSFCGISLIISFFIKHLIFKGDIKFYWQEIAFNFPMTPVWFVSI